MEMDDDKFDGFPTTDEEVEAWCSDPSNAATPEQMNLIIRLSDARDEIEQLKAENERLREAMEGAIKSYDEEIKDQTARRFWIHKMKEALNA
jgi:hypothetical protein